jgi:hypothetical protein
MQIFSAFVPLAKVLAPLAVVPRTVFKSDWSPGVWKAGVSLVVPPLSQMGQELVKGSLNRSKITDGLLA